MNETIARQSAQSSRPQLLYTDVTEGGDFRGSLQSNELGGKEVMDFTGHSAQEHRPPSAVPKTEMESTGKSPFAKLLSGQQGHNPAQTFPARPPQKGAKVETKLPMQASTLFKKVPVLGKGEQHAVSQSSEERSWTDVEDSRLRDAVLKNGNDWSAVADFVTSGQNCQKVTPEECEKRWASTVSKMHKKGPWTADEDGLVIELVRINGPKKWSTLAQFVPGRTGKQCRERWVNHLSPDVNKGEWTEEEERVLLEQHQKLGNQWCKIAQALPGRSENAVKNRWNSFANRCLVQNGKPGLSRSRGKGRGKRDGDPIPASLVYKTYEASRAAAAAGKETSTQPRKKTKAEQETPGVTASIVPISSSINPSRNPRPSTALPFSYQNPLLSVTGTKASSAGNQPQRPQLQQQTVKLQQLNAPKPPRGFKAIGSAKGITIDTSLHSIFDKAEPAVMSPLFASPGNPRLSPLALSPMLLSPLASPSANFRFSGMQGNMSLWPLSPLNWANDPLFNFSGTSANAASASFATDSHTSNAGEQRAVGQEGGSSGGKEWSDTRGDTQGQKLKVHTKNLKSSEAVESGFGFSPCLSLINKSDNWTSDGWGVDMGLLPEKAERQQPDHLGL